MTTNMQGDLPIDVNAASTDDLLPIDGIGPALAQRIVQYREEHGPFADLDELVAVRGIGPVLLDQIRPQISLTSAPQGAPPEEATVLASVTRPLEPEPTQLTGPLQLSEEAETGGQSPRGESHPPPPSDAQPEPQPMSSLAEERAEPSETDEEQEGTMREEQIAPEPEVEEPQAAEPAEESVETEHPEEILEQSTPEAEKATKEPEAPPVAAAETDAGRGFWSGFLLVAGGAIAGALVMLLVLLAYSGTLSYASRSEVDALSRNLDTVYQNSEVAWERLDRLAAENADLTAKVDRIMQLSGRVAEIEQGMSDMQEDLSAVESSVKSVESDLASLRDTYDTRLDKMDTTLADQGELLDRMESDLAETRATVATMQERLTRHDAFFGALRDLLIDMQGLPADEAEAQQSPAPEKEASGK